MVPTMASPDLADAPAAAIAPDDTSAGARESDAAKTPAAAAIDIYEVRSTGIPFYTSCGGRVGYFIGTKDEINGTYHHALVFDHYWPRGGSWNKPLPMMTGRVTTGLEMFGYSVWNEILAASLRSHLDATCGASAWEEILAASLRSRSHLDAACGASAGHDDDKDDMPDLEDAPAAAIAPDDADADAAAAAAAADARESDAPKTPAAAAIDMDKVRRTGIQILDSCGGCVGYFIGTKDEINGGNHHALVFDHYWNQDMMGRFPA
jgi:hypothetical protein